MKPRLLDLFCGAGGAAKGYQRAGFYVVGVDIKAQPRYCGDEFFQADAMTYPLEGFDAIHASPPCQAYSDLAARNGNADDHPRLIAAVREALQGVGKPYIIENVEGAPLHTTTVLCGTMFAGLRVIRHRLFESNTVIYAPPLHPRHPLAYTVDKRKAHHGKCDEWLDYVQVTGGGNCSVEAARDALGISWMTKDELNEAIPPAYTYWLGKHLMAALGRAA